MCVLTLFLFPVIICRTVVLYLKQGKNTVVSIFIILLGFFGIFHGFTMSISNLVSKFFVSL